MSEQQRAVRVLENQEDIDKVKRLTNRVAFSIYFRRRNVEQHKHELKAVEKIQRFLGSESHEGYTKTSKLWVSMGQTVAQHIDQINKVIEEAKGKDASELAFLEQIKEHTYGDGNYDHDYFTAILPYAEVNGDTEEFNSMLKAMMRESGFLPNEENNIEVEQVVEVEEDKIEEEKVDDEPTKDENVE